MSESPNIFDATTDNFQQGVIDNSHKVPVVVDFWADWCQPCKILMPILSNLVTEYNGGFVLAKVNTEQQQQLATDHGVRSIPTVKIYRHGKIVDEFTGAQSEDFIRAILDRYIASEADEIRTQAMQAIRNGDRDSGRTLLEKAAELEPGNANIQIDLAHLDAEQKNYSAASERLHNLGIADRDRPEVTGLLAKMEFAAAAESVADKKSLLADIETSPENSEARYQLAAISITDGDYETALDQLLQILIRDRQYNDDAGRRAMLAIFDMLGNEHELVGTYRRKMFNAMN